MSSPDPIKLNNIFTSEFLENPHASLTPPPADPAELEAYINAHLFDRTKLPPEDSHIFFYQGVPIGSRGNIVAITGKAKSRKTVIASALGSSFLLESGFLGFTADVKEGESILHIDSEQGYLHYFESVMRMLRDGGHKDDTPRNFVSLHSRDASVELRIELLDYALEKFKPTLVIVDGISDFVTDINKQEEATAIGEKLLAWSYKYNCLIIVVIHTTKTTGYMTGALGTHLEKKAQTVIKVEKDEENEEVSHVHCQYARDKGFKSFTIQYDEKVGHYVHGEEQEVKTKGKRGDKSPENYKPETITQIVQRMFGYSEEIQEAELQGRLYNAVKQITGDKLGGMEKRQWIKYLNQQAIIFQNPTGAWMRPPVGATSNHTTGGQTQTGLFDENTPPGDGGNDELPF